MMVTIEEIATSALLFLWTRQTLSSRCATRAVECETLLPFAAGEPVFEVTDPEGHVHVMQVYAQIVDPHLNFEQLAGLEDRFALTKGWSFSSRVLDEGLKVSTTDGSPT